VEALRSWSRGKDKHLPFCIPVIWKEQIDHIAGCYFCMIIVKGFSKKNKHSTPISKLQFSFERPVPHVVDAPKPVFSYLPYLEDDTLRYSSTSTDDDMSVDSFSKSCWLLPDASLFIWPGWKKWLNSWFESTQTIIWADGIKITRKAPASSWNQYHILSKQRARHFSVFHFQWWPGVFPWSKIPLRGNGFDTVQIWRMDTLHTVAGSKWSL